MPKTKRRQRKSGAYRPKPGAELTIRQLEAIARYLGYSLVCIPASADLYHCRTGNIEARGELALNHLRSLYVERDLGTLADIPELATSGGEL